MVIFILAFPISDPIKAMIPTALLGADPLPPPQGQVPAPKKTGSFLPATSLKKMLMLSFWGASGMERYGPASDVKIGMEVDPAPKEG